MIYQQVKLRAISKSMWKKFYKNEKLIIVGLLISSLLCYLEWGKANHNFLFEVEYDLFFKRFQLTNFFHPFVIIPLFGQLIFLIAIFYKKHPKKLVISGIAFISLLVLIILLAGILSLNLKIIASTIPFILLSIYYILSIKKPR